MTRVDVCLQVLNLGCQHLFHCLYTGVSIVIILFYGTFQWNTTWRYFLTVTIKTLIDDLIRLIFIVMKSPGNRKPQIWHLFCAMMLYWVMTLASPQSHTFLSFRWMDGNTFRHKCGYLKQIDFWWALCIISSAVLKWSRSESDPVNEKWRSEVRMRLSACLPLTTLFMIPNLQTLW